MSSFGRGQVCSMRKEEFTGIWVAERCAVADCCLPIYSPIHYIIELLSFSWAHGHPARLTFLAPLKLGMATSPSSTNSTWKEMMSATSGLCPLKECMCIPLALLSSHWLNTDVMVRSQAAILGHRLKPRVKNDKGPTRPVPPIFGLLGKIN